MSVARLFTTLLFKYATKELSSSNFLIISVIVFKA